MRVTVICLESDPAELVQATVIVFAPGFSETVAGLLVAALLVVVQVGVGVPVTL